MKHSHALSLVFGGPLPHLAFAIDAPFVTDLDEFRQLVPCASIAVTYEVGQAAYSADCGDDKEKWQSCICPKKEVSKHLIKSITSNVGFGCGETASADMSSASMVFAKYCDPDVKVKFSTQVGENVDMYITDISEMDYLAACASKGLSAAVMTETKDRCPEDASGLAPCVCSKKGVADDVHDNISKSVKSFCSFDEDITSALSFFEGYCDMTNGTTSFAKPEPPPGDMTYHITALPQFRSLDECAQKGLSSAVLEQTSGNCPADEQALASCACLKSSVNNDISSSVKNIAKLECESTAKDDVSSALEVLEFYCSAAEDKVTATGVEEVASETDGSPESRTGSDSLASETNGSDDDDDNSNAGESNKTAIIAGAVVGGLIGIALLIGLGIVIRRKSNKARSNPAPKISAPQEYNGMPELIGSHSNDSTAEIVKAASPAPESDYYPGKPELGGGPPTITELPPGIYKPYRPPELEGEVAVPGMPSTGPIAEMPPSAVIVEMAATETRLPHKELPPSPIVSKYNKSYGRSSPATTRDSNATSPLSPMTTGGSTASRWRQPDQASEIFEMEANPVHKI